MSRESLGAKLLLMCIGLAGPLVEVSNRAPTSSTDYLLMSFPCHNLLAEPLHNAQLADIQVRRRCNVKPMSIILCKSLFKYILKIFTMMSRLQCSPFQTSVSPWMRRGRKLGEGNTRLSQTAVKGTGHISATILIQTPHQIPKSLHP